MRVAPLPSDPVVPPPPRPILAVSGQNTAGSVATSRSSSHGKPAKLPERSELHQLLAVSCTTWAFGLLSAAAQIRDESDLSLAAAIAGTTCLLVLVFFLCLYSRIDQDLIEVVFVCQVLVLNVTVMILPLSHEDPFHRSVYLTWHSAVFKLLPLACARISCSVIQLAGSVAIDCGVQLIHGMLTEGSADYDLQSIAFLVSITCYVAMFCFFKSRRRRRCQLVEQGLQEMLDKVLTEVFTSWVLLDSELQIRRSLADTKPKRARSLVDPVLDMFSDGIRDDSATSELREALLAARKSSSRTSRMQSKLRRSGGEEQYVDVVIMCASKRDDTARSSAGSLESTRCPLTCDVEVDKAYYAVGISTKPPPPTSNPPTPHLEEAPQSPRPTQSAPTPQQRVNSLAHSEEGGSADASVVSAVARDPRRILGADNHSSSIFDIPPISRDEVEGDKTFTELVELGRREHWIVEPHQLCLLEDKVLGSGTFGTVLGGTFYGASVAIKMPNSDKKEHLPLLNELRTLRRLRHPNIVLFLAAHVTSSSNDMALVFELMEGPTLHDWMKGQAHPIEYDAGKLNLLRDISLALRYLHQQDKTLVHGDLKGSNVFVEGSGGPLPRAKLGDFGLSRFLYKTEHVMGGSLRWMAPEIATGHDRSPSCKADIFSLGALVSFVLTDIKPFEGVDRNQILSMMRRGNLPKLHWPQKDSEPVSRLVRLGDLCYSVEPSKRPDIMRVLAVMDWCRGNMELERSPSVLM